MSSSTRVFKAFDYLFRKDDILWLDLTLLMPMITWAKKKSKLICLYRTKGTYCGYIGNYKKIKYQHSF